MDLQLKVHTENHPDDEFHGKDVINTYISHFNDVQQELVNRNPTGWEDELEARIHHFATEAGGRQGTHVVVSQNNSGATIINVYSPYAARSMGILPMSHRTPAEEEKRKVEKQLAHEQFGKAVMERLERGAKRMHDAGLQSDLFSDGDFTIDPDAEDPQDVYRPK
jgi:hypothetical protein